MIRKTVVVLVAVVAAASSSFVGAEGPSPVGAPQQDQRVTEESPSPTAGRSHGHPAPPASTTSQHTTAVGDDPSVAETESSSESEAGWTAGKSGAAWEHLPFHGDCLEPVPATAGVSGITDNGHTVVVDVLVLLDRMNHLSRAEFLIERAEQAYAPLGIRLNPKFEFVELRGTDVVDLLAQARVAAAEFSLDAIDVVYVFSSVDLTYAGGSSVAGMANCIGGVRFKDRLQSIAISEAYYKYEVRYLGAPQAFVTVFKDGSALIAAHEIAHLLGAHHHYANCVENASASRLAERREFMPCTVMDQTLFFSALRFGQLEGAVVRGHAFKYASP